MSLRRGAMGWSALCDCGISWSHSITFFETVPFLLFNCCHFIVQNGFTTLTVLIDISKRLSLLHVFEKVKNLVEPRHEISNNVICATSKYSDQPAHMRSLVRALLVA